MENDILGGSEEPTDAKPDAGSNGESVPNLTDQLRDVLGPTISSIGQSLQALEAQQGAMNERIDGLAPTGGEPTPTPEEGSEFQKLYDNPNEYMSNVMKEVLDKRGDGGVGVALEQLANQHLVENERRIDEYYGEGTWKDKVVPVISDPMNRMNLDVRANGDSMRTLVDAAVGQEAVRDDLIQRRNNVLTTKRTPPSLPGGGGPSTPQPQEHLSDAEREFAKSVGSDEKTFLGLRNLARTGSVSLDEYLAVSGKEKQ